MDWNRRRFLAAAGLSGATGLAGCTVPSVPSSSGTETGSNDPAETPTPVEDDTYELAVEHDVETWDDYDPDWTHPTAAPATEPSVETVVEDLEIPWDLSFAPNGDLFISERVGKIARYASDSLEELAAPDVLDRADAIAPGEEGGWWAGGSEGGLMGISIHPNYPDVPLLYAIYTQEAHGGYRNRVVYYDVSASNPTETETVVVDDIAGHEIIHNGARLTFGPRNYLWITTGDANDRERAADPGALAGSVLRIEPNGSPAADNPDVEGGDPRVFSWGHRNPQGITFLPDGTPIVTEHGPGARDEVNVLRPGGNYGWAPEGEHGRDGDTYPGTDYDRPVVNTGPDTTWAPPGCTFYTGDAAAEWQNRLLVGGLASQRVQIVTVYPSDGEAPSAEEGRRFDADWMDPDYDAVAHHALEDELGRIRHVETGPDGEVYAITSNRDGRASDGFPQEGDDRVVKLHL